MAVVPTDIAEPYPATIDVEPSAAPLLPRVRTYIDEAWETVSDRFWLSLDTVFYTEPTEVSERAVIGAAVTGFFLNVGYFVFRNKKETPISDRVRTHLKRRALWTLLGTGVTVASAAATIRFLVPVLPEQIVLSSPPRLALSVLPGALLVGTVITDRKRVALKRALWAATHATLPLGVFFSQIMVPTWTSYLLMNTGFQLVSLAVQTEEQLFWLGNAVMCLAAPYPPWMLLGESQDVSALSIILGLFMAGSAIWYDTTRVLECGDRKGELDYVNRSFGPYKRIVEIFIYIAKSALGRKKKKRQQSQAANK